MRVIRNFVVVRTSKPYPDVSDESRGVGLLYPSPHFYVYKFDFNDDSEPWKHIRGRPFCEPTPLVRDSVMSKSSLGIMILTDESDKRVRYGAMQHVASIIKNTSDDLGMSQYGIITDEVDNSRFVDSLALQAMISKSQSIFSKRV